MELKNGLNSIISPFKLKLIRLNPISVHSCIHHMVLSMKNIIEQAKYQSILQDGIKKKIESEISSLKPIT